MLFFRLVLIQFLLLHFTKLFLFVSGKFVYVGRKITTIWTAVPLRKKRYFTRVSDACHMITSVDQIKRLLNDVLGSVTAHRIFLQDSPF